MAAQRGKKLGVTSPGVTFPSKVSFFVRVYVSFISRLL